MPYKTIVAGTALLLLSACQGSFLPKSAEAICEEAGHARQSNAFEACVEEQRAIAAKQRAVYFRRTHRGPRGR